MLDRWFWVVFNLKTIYFLKADPYDPFVLLVAKSLPFIALRGSHLLAQGCKSSNNRVSLRGKQTSCTPSYLDSKSFWTASPSGQKLTILTVKLPLWCGCGYWLSWFSLRTHTSLDWRLLRDFIASAREHSLHTPKLFTEVHTHHMHTPNTCTHAHKSRQGSPWTQRYWCFSQRTFGTVEGNWIDLMIAEKWWLW